MTEDAPPRKPSGATRWVLALALVLGVYLGGYASLRVRGDLEARLFYTPLSHRPRYRITAPAPPWEFPTRWRTLFRPCIAVEEWWRNP